MDGAILTRLLLILLVGLLSWNNIPRVTPAPPNIKALKEKASAQDVFHLCENLKKTCVGGVAACANYSYSIKIKQLVCCLECKGETEFIQTNHNNPCEPDPCGKHGTCEVTNYDTGRSMKTDSDDVFFVCECEEGWKGHLCDTRKEYLDIFNKNCSIASCKAPNVCVHRDALGAKIKSTLQKHYKGAPGVHGDVMNDPRKLEQLTEVIQRTSSRRFYEVCLCSPGKRGIRCDLRCKAGTWGLYCLEKCDDNCLKPKCGSKDGKCDCKSGYIQSKTGVCVLQPATEDNCQEYCKHGTCEGSTCTCNYAQGPFCDTKCSKIKPHPRYGKNCEKSCGGCAKLPCARETGVCPSPIRPGAKLCLESYFTGDRCELSDGVIAEAQMTLGKVDDSVPDDEFETALARIENDQMKLNLIKEQIRTYLKQGTPAALGLVGLSIMPIGGAAIFVGGALIIIGFLGSHEAANKLYKKGGFLKLLQYEEPGLVADISLPLPPGANSSTYKDAMQKIMENVAEGFQTDLIPGLGVRKESIRVTSVRAIEQPDVGNSPPDSLPLVVGGAIVATVAVVAALIALTLMKRKPSKNNARASIRPNNLTISRTGTGITQMIAVSQQQFGQQMRKASDIWA